MSRHILSKRRTMKRSKGRNTMKRSKGRNTMNRSNKRSNKRRTMKIKYGGGDDLQTGATVAERLAMLRDTQTKPKEPVETGREGVVEAARTDRVFLPEEARLLQQQQQQQQLARQKQQHQEAALLLQQQQQLQRQSDIDGTFVTEAAVTDGTVYYLVQFRFSDMPFTGEPYRQVRKRYDDFDQLRQDIQAVVKGTPEEDFYKKIFADEVVSVADMVRGRGARSDFWSKKHFDVMSGTKQKHREDRIRKFTAFFRRMLHGEGAEGGDRPISDDVKQIIYEFLGTGPDGTVYTHITPEQHAQLAHALDAYGPDDARYLEYRRKLAEGS